MTIEKERTRLTVPFEVTDPHRIPVARYYNRDFFEAECELFWPRVWQMACRLEEIPNRGDFVEYTFLDQSIIVVRVDDEAVRAYHNACRHRGVPLVADRGNCKSGFVCPFHGWCYGLDGANTFIYQPSLFQPKNMDPDDLALRTCRVEIWGGCAFINLDDDAPPLRQSIEPFASFHDKWKVEGLRTEWWLSCDLQVNWKLAMEAFMEGYHVMGTHPQLNPPRVKGAPPVYRPDGLDDNGPGSAADNLLRDAAWVGSSEFIDMQIKFMSILSTGMAGMFHEKDVKVAESLRDLELTPNPVEAGAEWRRALNDAVMASNRDRGIDVPDLNEIESLGLTSAVNFCFPHFFLLPTGSSASQYRIRPTGPESCLFEIWSLTRYAPGEEPPPPTTPIPMAADDPRWPPIPAQDFSNLPIQQRGIHTKGFDSMRLSHRVEGQISNYQRLIDGYLAGLDYAPLVAAEQKVSGPIDAPIRDLGL